MPSPATSRRSLRGHCSSSSATTASPSIAAETSSTAGLHRKKCWCLPTRSWSASCTEESLLEAEESAADAAGGPADEVEWARARLRADLLGGSDVAPRAD